MSKKKAAATEELPTIPIFDPSVMVKLVSSDGHVFFATDFVCRNLGIQGALDPLLASWLPVLAFGSVGVVLLDGMRT